MSKADRPDFALETEIVHLRDLDLAELKRRWVKLYDCPAPRYFRREMLIRAVAYKMQVLAYGDLKPPTKKLLRTIVASVRSGNEEGIGAVPRIKPGTKLIRVWKDRTHIILALESGFEWEGNRYASLSKIARAITGTNWNGLVFFGIKPRPSGNKNALRPRKESDA